MAIYLKDVIFEFETHRVIDQITLNVSEQRIGIVGVNGSGKSTLARLISGLIAPISGSIRINDIDIYKDRKAALKTVGIIFQNPDHQIIFPTCVEEISFGLMQQGMTRIEAEERSNEILLKFNRLKWSDQLAHNLSQGQRHFLCLIAVLAMNPDVIILDEPYAGLDLPTSLQLRHELNKLDQQIVMITHNKDILVNFDRILWIDNGKIIKDGSFKNVMPDFEEEMQRRANVSY
ncbi:energy-coupling factor ABC transporter ATP-binding protein [Amylibacter sp.]|jgi:biotin transport system ATP-binding protein|nr:energy-coupling factor ABC transporter ATP-binding protein [Amylibacter sp.]MDA9788492.1 energy-coupling factor ABC transporter ATP-binding protein [Amylibacter sp.]MDA9911590.1 energy-coupling factor ABC transporter ATP-binding protein [Amylibacter sp.]MDB4008550.1 energy-coupling factor ABC transporter ATP-binding protein [Amylibacter sp.]MDC0095926.1 energy-coupling factor ABC transporter ATP-binding protein [Amylibacter sp.]|tara:strand:- start:2745 stop:3443 length:699 start_codon:yes stop_codon:yes gene_type:complete